jgi:hypothetical protein
MHSPSCRRGDSLARTASPRSPFKKELVHRRSWPMRRELTSEVFEYIEAFYSPTRRHSTLGYLSPAQFEEGSHFNNKNNPRSFAGHPDHTPAERLGRDEVLVRRGRDPLLAANAQCDSSGGWSGVADLQLGGEARGPHHILVGWRVHSGAGGSYARESQV